MGESPIPTPRRIGDAGIEEKYRGGEPSTRSTVLHSGLLTHLHSSHPQGWIVELGLLCRKRWRRTPHDECKWLAFDSPGDRGSAGTRAAPSGSVLRARIDRSKGCARASAQFRTRELGTARKRAGIVAEVVRRRLGPEKRRAHHSTELVPRRDRGPSPRIRNSVATRCKVSRKLVCFLRVSVLARGQIAFGKQACESASFFVGPRRQSRGIDEWPVGSSRLGNEARRGRGGLPNEGRHLGS